MCLLVSVLLGTEFPWHRKLLVYFEAGVRTAVDTARSGAQLCSHRSSYPAVAVVALSRCISHMTLLPEGGVGETYVLGSDGLC